MAFRYEIWQYTDPEEYDVFNINNYEKVYDVTPNDSKFKLSVKKEGNYIFNRVQPDGSLIFTGDNYDIVKGIYESTTPTLLFAYDLSSADRSSFIKDLFFNKADFIGFMRPRTMVINLDRCYITVTTDTFDVYTKFLRTIKNEYNAFDISSRVNVKAGGFGYEYETYSRNYSTDDDSLPDPPADAIVGIGHPLEGIFDKGLLWRAEAIGIEFGEDPPVLDYWNVTETYKREYAITDSNVVPPEVGAGFVYLEEVSTGQYKWIRTPFNITSPNYTQTTGSLVAFWNIDTDTMTFTTRQRGFLLKNLIAEIRRQNESYSPTAYVPLSSFFLLSSVNPVTGITNKYKNLILMQLSDVKPTSDPATIMNISLEDILQWLESLQVYWSLEWNESQQKPILRLEHINYYVNGRSYTTQNVFHTVEDSDGLREISYNDTEQPAQDKITFSNQTTDDFTGIPIAYNGALTNDEQREFSYDVTTDLAYILSEPEKAPNDGVLMLATTVDDGVYSVNYEIGAESGEVRANGILSTANIMEDLWIYNRPTLSGRMNNQDKNFEYISRQRVQPKVTIRMSYKELNPYNLIYSSIGYGEIDTASFDIKNCRWSATIRYE